MTAEEKYLTTCYGTVSEMHIYRIEKDGVEMDCHSASEFVAMRALGWKKKNGPSIGTVISHTTEPSNIATL